MKRVNIYYGNIKQFTIDANKHPELQRMDLINIIKNNDTKIIDIYCNSPYVLFYLTLIRCYSESNIPNNERGIFKDIEIETKHFEITIDDKTIEGLYYKDMISDKNLLNNYLELTNKEISEFFDINDKYKK